MKHKHVKRKRVTVLSKPVRIYVYILYIQNIYIYMIYIYTVHIHVMNEICSQTLSVQLNGVAFSRLTHLTNIR